MLDGFVIILYDHECMHTAVGVTVPADGIMA